MPERGASGSTFSQWARVLRECGASVREYGNLRNTTLPGIDPSDGRHMEIVATGLAMCRGIPFAVDAAVVSPVRGDGSALPRAAHVAGVALAAAEAGKRRTYHGLVGNPLFSSWSQSLVRQGDT